VEEILYTSNTKYLCLGCR